MRWNSSLSRPVQTAKVQVLRSVLKPLKKPLTLNLHHQMCHSFCSAHQRWGELFLSLPGPLSVQLCLSYLLTAFPPCSEGEMPLWCERSSLPCPVAAGSLQPALKAVLPAFPLRSPAFRCLRNRGPVLPGSSLPSLTTPGSQHACHLTVCTHTALHPLLLPPSCTPFPCSSPPRTCSGSYQNPSVGTLPPSLGARSRVSGSRLLPHGPQVLVGRSHVRFIPAPSALSTGPFTREGVQQSLGHLLPCLQIFIKLEIYK